MAEPNEFWDQLPLPEDYDPSEEAAMAPTEPDDFWANLPLPEGYVESEETAAAPTDDVGLGEHMTSQYIRGVGGYAAEIPRWAALKVHGPDEDLIEIFDNIDRKEGTEAGKALPDLGFFDNRDVDKTIFEPFDAYQVFKYRKGGKAERKAMRKGLVADIKDATESDIWALGDQFQEWVKKSTRVSAILEGLGKDNSWEDPGAWPVKAAGLLANDLPQGLGSFTGMVIPTVLARKAVSVGKPTFGIDPRTMKPAAINPTSAGLVAGGASGSVVNEAGVFQEALDEGASYEQALQAGDVAGVVGVSEVMPLGFLLHRVDKASGGVLRRLAARGKDMGAQGMEEFVQEAGMSVANEITKHVVFNPETSLWEVAEKAGEEGAVGFTIGMLIEGITQMMPGRRRRGREAKALETSKLEDEATRLEAEEARLIREAELAGLDALELEAYVTEGMMAIDQHQGAIEEADVALDEAEQVDLEIAAAFEERDAKAAKQLADDMTKAIDQRNKEAAEGKIQERLRGELLQEGVEAQQGPQPINPEMARALLNAGVSPQAILDWHEARQADLQAEMDADATPEADVAEEPALLEDQRADFAVTPEGTAIPRSEQPARTGQEAAEPSTTAERPFEAPEVTEQRELGREVGEALASLEPPTQPIAPESLPPLPAESAEAPEPLTWKRDKETGTYTDPEGRFTITKGKRDWEVKTSAGNEVFTGLPTWGTLTAAKAAVERARTREAAAEAAAPEGATRTERNTITDPNTGKTFEGTTYYDAEGKSLGTVMDINEDAIRNNPALQSWSRGVADKANEAATSPDNALAEPTEAQEEAGNYQKGHLAPSDIGIPGLEVSVENPAGSERNGFTQPHHYGYARRTMGADEDQVDVFVNKDIDPAADTDVYVIDQIDQESGQFDEHKAMVGFANGMAARRAYAQAYEKGWKVGKITKMSKSEFTAWLQDSAATQKPANPNTPVRFSKRRGADRAAVEEGQAEYESPEETAARESDERMTEIDEAVNDSMAAVRPAAEEPAYEKIEKQQKAVREGQKRLNDLAWRTGSRPQFVTEEEAVALGQKNADTIGGWFDPDTNTAYVILYEGISIEEAVKVAFHETVGHKGLRALYTNEEDLNKVLDDIYEKIKSRKPLMEIQSRYELDNTRQDDRRVLTEEYIAYVAEQSQGGEDAGILQRVVASVRQALRNMGVDIKQWTDNDIKALIRRGAGRLQAGKAMNRTMIKSEVKVAGTEEIVTIEEPAHIALRQTDKRIKVIASLRDCLNA